jgi:hypothetical protein
MREIVRDIFTWPWFSEPHGYNFNGHSLVTLVEISAFIPCKPSERIWRSLCGVAWPIF